MKDPIRWRDDPGVSSELKQLVSSAAPAPVLPPGIDHQLGLVASGTGSKVAVAAAAKSALGAKLGSGLLLAASITGGVVAYQQSRANAGAASEPPASAAQAPASATRVARQPGPEAPLEPSPEPSVPSISPDEPANVLPAAKPAAALPPKASAAPRSLSDEAQLLDRARRSLASSPGEALRLVGQHRRDFPEPRLAAEREVIAVQALLALGRRGEAEARAQALIGRAPDSIYAKRLRRLLGPAADRPAAGTGR